AQLLSEGLQEGLGSRGTCTGIEPTNPGDFPCWLRHEGQYHCEDAQSQGDDTPRRAAPHETFLLCCWLLCCLTTFTARCGMVMSRWRPNARRQAPSMAAATQERSNCLGCQGCLVYFLVVDFLGLPGRPMLQHRIENRQQLMHTRRQSDFFAFPCSEQPLIKDF